MNEDLEKYIADNFTNVQHSEKTLTFYCVRNSIYEAVRNNKGVFKGTMLDIGCGVMPYKSAIMADGKVERYIGMDIVNSDYHNRVVPDLAWDAQHIPLENESVDSAMATEFFEHYFDTQNAMKEIARVLRPDGVLFATVPFIWNLHEVPYDEYRFTPFSLRKHLEKAGFHNITIGALGGWKRALAQMIVLYIQFERHTTNENRFIRYAKPLILRFHRFLYENDVKPIEFKSGVESMYNGLYLVAYKK